MNTRPDEVGRGFTLEELDAVRVLHALHDLNLRRQLFLLRYHPSFSHDSRQSVPSRETRDRL